MESRFHSPYRHFAAGIAYLVAMLTLAVAIFSAFAYLIALVGSA